MLFRLKACILLEICMFEFIGLLPFKLSTLFFYKINLWSLAIKEIETNVILLLASFPVFRGSSTDIFLNVEEFMTTLHNSLVLIAVILTETMAKYKTKAKYFLPQ